MNNYINKFLFVHKTKKLLIRGTSARSYLIILPSKQSRPLPDALTRAASSGSALFAKVLKGVSIYGKG